MMNTKKLATCLLLGLATVGCGDDESPTTTNPGGDMGVDMGGGCPAAGDVMVTADVTANTTWDCPSYVLTDKIWVTNDSTLTIAPGTTIYGDPGSALLVTRGSQLQAIGTAASPIVFTSNNAPGDRATGDWAGVALLGSATINNGRDISTTATPIFEGNLEGIDLNDPRGEYGGTDDTSDCGTLNYVRIEFAGAELTTDNELNGLTLAACGSETEISYVQVHRGKDDGIEFFGGTAGMDHVVITGASDDSLDWDLGWRGDVQFLVVHQFPGFGDNGFEADNRGDNELATPRSNPRIYNATLIGTPTTRGMVLREGTRAELRNFIVQDFGTEPLDTRAATNDLDTEWPTFISIGNSFFFDNGAFTDESQVADDDDLGFDEEVAVSLGALANDFATDPGVADTSVTAPNYVPTNTALNGQATPPSGFDTAATFAGAFSPNGADWTDGWTDYPAN